MRLFSALLAIPLAAALNAQPICDELNAGFAFTVSGNSVEFDNTTTGAGLQTTYQWSFGDGTTSGAPNPSHTYTAAGAYEVCLYAISIYFNGGGTPTTCVDTACVEVVVGGGDPCDALVACFEALSTSALTVSFSNCSEPGTNTQYVWVFGDGSNGTGATPTHTYDQPGPYTVCVTAFWNGCEDTYCWPVIVQGGDTPCDGLEAAFSWTTTPNGTYFLNNTTGTGFQTTWAWTFGDGGTSSDAQPVHTYTTAGVYQVCLVVVSMYETSAGIITCTSDFCDEVLIQGGGNTCDDLAVEFTSSTAPNGTQFTSTTVGAGVQTSWAWTFGDGSSGSGPNPFHTYASPGVYLACVTVTTFYEVNGQLITCTDEYCNEVSIGGGGNICDQLNAGFTWTGGINGVQFSNATTGTGQSTTWYWTFGDGANSSDAQPFHSYAEPGFYEVCLYAISVYNINSGVLVTCVDTLCSVVEINGGTGPCDGLNAGFSFGNNGGSPATIFYSASTGIGPHWLWSFGDGTYSDNGPQGTHTYTAQGTYELCLTVWDWIPGTQDTCSETSCQTVVIEGGSNTCDDLVVEFVSSSTPNGTQFTSTTVGAGVQTTWAWTFGDGSSGSGPNPFHTYASPGVYLACVTVTTFYEVNGQLITCTDEYCNEVSIGGGGNICDQLNAGFTWTGGINGVQFSNATTGTGFQTTWAWTFGDGGTSNDAQPFHTYDAPGVYPVCLVVVSMYETSAGIITCTSDFCDEALIQGGGNTCDDLLVEFTSSTTPNGTQFTSTTVGAGVQTTWAWTFGDGSSGSGPNPFHTYASPGVYLACVTVTTFYEVNGQLITCTDEYCNEVSIGGGGNICDELNAGFTWTGGINGVQFSNATTGTGFQTTWAWTFGDGGTSNDAQPFHTYDAPGVYPVCLVVVSMYETSAGIITCTSDFCDEVEVSGIGPCNSLNACFDVVVVDNNSFVFENCTTPSANIQYVWNFGDGASGSGANPDHSYAVPGSYVVCLTAYWENCVDSTCTTIVVESPGGCEPFEVDFAYGIQGNTAVFEATSSVPVVGFLWFFGDGTDGYGPVITHIYEPPGPFNVCLAAWYWNSNTQDTCWAEHCELVYPFGVGMGEHSALPVRIYPNPAHSAFTIEGLSAGTEVRIFSPEGRLVLARRTYASRETVDTSGLAPAVYSMELRTDAGSLWRRIAID